MRIDPTVKVAMQAVVTFGTVLSGLSYLFLAGALHPTRGGDLTDEQRRQVEYMCWCLRRWLLACLALVVVVWAL